MRKQRIYLIALSLLGINMAYAGTMGPTEKFDSWWIHETPCPTTDKALRIYPWAHVLSLSIGPAWASRSNAQSQNVPISSTVNAIYYPAKTINGFPYGEVFLGLQKQLDPKFYSQIGVEFGGGAEANMSGSVYQTTTTTQPYAYQYSISEGRVLIKGKLLVDPGYHEIRPYASIGLGVGFNTSHAFSIAPTRSIGGLSPPPLFRSNTLTRFTYTLGAGLYRALNEYWFSGIGYEIANWGKTQLGGFSSLGSPVGLSNDNFYVNSVQFSLTCIM